MRWIKHLTAAHQDEKMAALIEDLGAEAYGFYWLLVEHIAGPMENGKMSPEMTRLPSTFWTITGVSSKKFHSLCARLTKDGLISVRPCGERITISIPNILKYKDEYSKKYRHEPDKVPAEGDREQIESRRRAEADQKTRAAEPIPIRPDSPPKKDTTQAARDEAWAAPSPEQIANDLAIELHSKHPKLSSAIGAISRAIEALNRHPPETWKATAQRWRENHAIHCEMWARESAARPGSYIPFLDQWFSDGMCEQRPENHIRDGPKSKKEAEADDYRALIAGIDTEAEGGSFGRHRTSRKSPA